MSEPLVIIGNGMAAARLCEELARRALGRYAIAVSARSLSSRTIACCSRRCSQAKCRRAIRCQTGKLVVRSRCDLSYGEAVTAVDVALHRDARRRPNAFVRQARVRYRVTCDSVADCGR